jgi:hypothetical protein
MADRFLALTCLALVLSVAAALPAPAQVATLPPVDTPPPMPQANVPLSGLTQPPEPGVVFELLPDETAPQATPPGRHADSAGLAAAAPVRPPAGGPGGRQGIFQRLSLTGTWLPSLSRNDLGIGHLGLDVTLGFPMPTRKSPLLITPAFAVRYLDGPSTPDMPDRVYDASVQFRFLRRLTDQWAMDLAVRPGVHGDFQSDDNDALRIIGRGLAIYDWTSTTKLIFGVAHLARTDIRVLPVGGLILSPNDDWRWELVAPNPRIARRLVSAEGRTRRELWAYVAGEYGGGVWSITRADGAHDTATVNDYRIALGLEQRSPGGLGRHVEVGYVFGREIEFASRTPDTRLNDTLMLRAGASF